METFTVHAVCRPLTKVEFLALTDHPDPVAASLAFIVAGVLDPPAASIWLAFPECPEGEEARASVAYEPTNDNRSD